MNYLRSNANRIHGINFLQVLGENRLYDRHEHRWTSHEAHMTENQQSSAFDDTLIFIISGSTRWSVQFLDAVSLFEPSRLPKLAILTKLWDKNHWSYFVKPRLVQLWFAEIRSHVMSITSYLLFVVTLQVELSWDHQLYCPANRLGLEKRLVKTVYEQMCHINRS